MRIGVTSDLHGNLPILEPCDLHLICGDIIPLEIQCDMPASKKWLQTEFLEWVMKAECKHVVFIAGNHDFWFERNGDDELSMYNMFNKPTDGKLIYLHNQSWEFNYEVAPGVYKSINIFGTPYCKIFNNWAFMRDPDILEQLYAAIPEKCDILLSHDAPKLLKVGSILQSHFQVNVGNPQLADEIMRKQPKYCFCGHIHSGEHEVQEITGIKLANVSLLNENYDVSYNPLYLEI